MHGISKVFAKIIDDFKTTYYLLILAYSLRKMSCAYKLCFIQEAICQKYQEMIIVEDNDYDCQSWITKYPCRIKLLVGRCNENACTNSGVKFAMTCCACTRFSWDYVVT